MSSTRPSLRSRSASIVSASASIIGATLPSPLPRSSLRRSPAGHPASGSARGHRAQHRRSGARLPAIFDAQCDLHGRAEVILGRGSFTESYPLFGYDMAQYEQLFEEKLEVFAALLKGGPVTWKGSTRSALTGSDRLSADRERDAAHLGRRRRQPRIGDPGGALRIAVDPGDHRRRSDPLPALRRSVSRRRSRSSASRRSRSRCTRRATSPPPMTTRRKICGRTIRR